MSRARCVDLRSYNKGTLGIASFVTLRQAQAFAKSRGWSPKDATQAANRFCAFWIVGQCFGDSFRILKKEDGEYVDIPWPGIIYPGTTLDPGARR